MSTGQASAAFTRELERALQHLYDPVFLRSSPLMECLLRAERRSPTAFRGLVTEAIRRLQPSPTVPPQSRAWTIYQVLTMRYLEQLSQEEVGANLAYSARHIRRLEIAAVQELADGLWSRCDEVPVALSALAPDERRDDGGDAPREGAPSVAAWASREDELGRLAQSAPAAAVHLGQAVRRAMDVVAPLAQSGGVRVVVEDRGEDCQAMAQATVLRQALVSLFTAGVSEAQGGEMLVRLSVDDGDPTVRVEARGACVGEERGAEVREYLRVTAELAQGFGGSLGVSDVAGAALAATLTIACHGSPLVLAIDDNADALRLYERFLAGTRFRLLVTSDPEEGLELAVGLGVGAVILDIMIPDVDGWELLGRLRAHPALSDVPLIVCSILPHERLSTCLGAARFLRKPIGREGLLAALEGALRERPPECPPAPGSP